MTVGWDDRRCQPYRRWDRRVEQCGLAGAADELDLPQTQPVSLGDASGVAPDVLEVGPDRAPALVGAGVDRDSPHEVDGQSTAAGTGPRVAIRVGRLVGVVG